MTTERELQTTPEVGGMGHSVKRKEDPRFIRGAGQYIDDFNLPGQLWLDIVRSPYAHATIKGIDSTEALKVPGVLAVVTGKDLEGYGLHWMPTLAGDRQMVLPTDTVMYQSQEVAAVIATSRYAAADGIAAVLVDYEPLPVIIDPHKALEKDAFVLRPDRAADKQTNHIWHWESGDKAKADSALAAAEVRIEEDIYIPRIHVASIETCGCIADWDPVRQQLTLHMTSQAPHAIRTVLALVAAGCLPEGRRGEGSGPAGSGGSPATTFSPSPAPSGPTQRPPIVPPTPTPRPTFLVHVVAKGESLNTIAHAYGTTARSIAFWNRGTYPSLDPESAKYRPDLLKLGWTLFLLPNDTVDEQDLPDASESSTGPEDSAIPE